jgi:hypothetical protein
VTAALHTRAKRSPLGLGLTAALVLFAGLIFGGPASAFHGPAEATAFARAQDHAPIAIVARAQPLAAVRSDGEAGPGPLPATIAPRFEIEWPEACAAAVRPETPTSETPRPPRRTCRAREPPLS